jgi:DNA modification methylase
LGKGIILDPFAGGGSTLAAAEALGYDSIGVEINPEYIAMAQQAVPRLSALTVEWTQPRADLESNVSPAKGVSTSRQPTRPLN